MKRNLIGKIVHVEYSDHAGTWGDELRWGEAMKQTISPCHIIGVVLKDTKKEMLVCSEWAEDMMFSEEDLEERGTVCTWTGKCLYGWVVKGAIKKLHILGELKIEVDGRGRKAEK